MADIHVLKPGYWDAHGKEGTRERWGEYRVQGFRAMPFDTFGYYIEDSWGQLMRIGDKWVCFRVEQPWRHFADPFDVRSYTSAFCAADKIEGPWSKWKPAVRYGGHAGDQRCDRPGGCRCQRSPFDRCDRCRRAGHRADERNSQAVQDAQRGRDGCL